MQWFNGVNQPWVLHESVSQVSNGINDECQIHCVHHSQPGHDGSSKEQCGQFKQTEHYTGSSYQCIRSSKGLEIPR